MGHRRISAALLVLALTMVLAPPAVPRALAGGPAAGATAGTALASLGEPSIAYQESLAHAGDGLRFAPGAPASVPFRPRPSDRWRVGGSSPRVLPAGDAGGTAAGPATGTQSAFTPTIGATGFVAPLAPVSSSGLRREVFGFLPYWELTDPSLRLDYSVLSTIGYFATDVLADGSLDTSTSGWSGWRSATLTGVINTAHGQGTRVVLTVERFSWSASQAAVTTALLSSPTASGAAAATIAAEVRSRGADGVNLDFEPIPSGQSANFVTFVRLLRTALDAQAPGYQLTFDATGEIANYDVTALTAPGAADAVFIMGYDYRTASALHTGSIDPLTGPAYDLTQTVDAYLARTNASQIILGLPYYGRAWSVTGADPNAATLANDCSAVATYAYAIDGLLPIATRQWDPIEQTPWLAYQQGPTSCHSDTVTRELYYDDVQSLGLRYDLVNARNLRGSGMWALGYDGTHPELYALLGAKYVNDTTPPTSGILDLPDTVTDEGFRVGWVGLDDWNGVSGYDVQVSIDGGAWTAWLTGTPATSVIYPGQTGHGYAFRVRGTDGVGNVGGWTVTSVYAPAGPFAVGGFARVVNGPVNVRSDGSLGGTILAQAPTGTVVALIGGPVVANGYTWYQVTEPIASWSPVAETLTGVWMAAGGNGTTLLVPVVAPNATLVNAGMSGFSVVAGPPDGTAVAAAARQFTPNGDGIDDTITVRWTNNRAFGATTLNVLRPTGSLVGSVGLGARAAGAQQFAWDGKVGGSVLPSGTYALQLVAADGGTTYTAPSADPTAPGQLNADGVNLARIDLARYAGPDRYATAAALAMHRFAPGVPVVYVANGLSFADALGGSAAAGKEGGALLLVTSSAIPDATAAALSYLKPGRIVVLGSTSVVGTGVATALAAYTGGAVSRLGGADRYATAAVVATAVFAAGPAPAGVPVVYVATGLDFPDGLVAAAAAVATGGAVLLTLPSALPTATAAAIATLHPGRIVVVGGPAAVSQGVMDQLGTMTSGGVTRLAGGDRYATALAVVAQTAWPSSSVVYLATGLNFPDALAAGPLGRPIVLVPSGALSAATASAVQALAPVRVVALGSAAIVPDADLTTLRTALDP